MKAAGLLDELRRRGVRLEAVGGTLRLRAPVGVLGDAELEALRAAKPALLSALATEAEERAEVGWRVAAMEPQVPKRGPIPFLVARDVPAAPGCCLACGDRLGDRRSLRCSPCAQAASLALHQAREGVGA